MFRTISFFGLACWAPDVLSQDPNSMYNLLHEHIALVTFEQVAAGFGYSHLGIDLSLICNFTLMRKLYCNFVYSYMHGIAKSENDEVAEGDSGSQLTYHINIKDGRSTKVKSFFRMLDSQPKRRNCRAEHTREDPLTPLESELFALPKFTPIDWFDPGYWHTTLTVHERLDYIEHGVHIGLPLAEDCQTWEQCSLWKNLPVEEFMETYGNAVLALYKMPTAEEVEQLRQWGEELEELDLEAQLGDEGSGDEGSGGYEYNSMLMDMSATIILYLKPNK
ncbi:uncharacterized protein LACBIDRAFT_332196 [Laccaria bicolor S238N-H82]|uniref:Predicted protein n=1 Tax=Laccaria bicolor (strain S238N-H82 / ATCC MYA-4686) TaxID=486041 RepID=B0DRX2_LACBS|nr:uncharacterized protein LACBIDRAFT_332196 [Laccaria bicolor S238N-H82]EDR02689.1 predicted protein [Laccaria bicolor S238N-H82]|eukprot:XP_001886733.1 predicted protein [Laccaria bicolor S238N-H82]